MANNNEPQSLNKNLPRSNIESIDTALFKYVDEELNLHCTVFDGFKKVPVIWSNSERAYQIKNNVEIRDNNGTLIPPIISISRKSISKDPQKKGTFQANLSPQHNRVVYSEEINQEKTSNFANADTLKDAGQLNFITSKKNKKKVYKYKSVLMPVYIEIVYEIEILTSYMQQLNEIIQPFMTRTAGLNYFILKHESFRYESFIQQDFTTETKITSDDEKRHEAKISIKVLGQLIGDDTNQDISTEKITENPVEIKFPKESSLLIADGGIKKQKEIPEISPPAPQIVTIGNLVKKVFLVGDGVNFLYTITHDMNSKDMYVNIREVSGDCNMVMAGVSFINQNSIVLNFGNAIGVNSHYVTIIS